MEEGFETEVYTYSDIQKLQEELFASEVEQFKKTLKAEKKQNLQRIFPQILVFKDSKWRLK